jgi:hypothetical protein
MFRGVPPVATHVDAEFSHVRHIAVGPLTNAEVDQTSTLLPELEELYKQASEQLRVLLQNIFNLHLLAELLRAGVACHSACNFAALSRGIGVQN